MRIVGGLAGGRRLTAPAKGTRPTSDQVREALFNTLASSLRLDGARVLDLYAGSGAVGLEALSRGAGHVVLVESNRVAVEVLRANVAAVGLPGAQVVQRPVNRFLAEPPDELYDLAFADPPYDLPDVDVTALAITLTRWVRQDGFVVVERGARSGGPQYGAIGYAPGQERRYGDTVLWYGRPK